MSDVRDTVVDATKEVEWILENKFGARGRGLHTKADSVQSHLGGGLLRKIHFLATIRNKLQHEMHFTKADVPLQQFVQYHKDVLAGLAALDPLEADDDDDDDDDDDADEIPRRPASVARGRRSNTAGLVVLGLIGGIALLSFSSCPTSSSQGSANDAPSVTSAATPTSAPLWSVEHPNRASQAFPWREEQATFVASGETGQLPNETLWRVASTPHETKVNGATVLELEMELGGGTTKGKVRFRTRDSFGRLAVSAIVDSAEVSTKSARRSKLEGVGLRSNGRSLDAPFECQREVPQGCGQWVDQGLTYVALSRVSFKNALNIR